MLGIYAHSFMTATRTEPTRPNAAEHQNRNKRRWLPKGHWWLRQSPAPDRRKRHAGRTPHPQGT